MALKIIVSGLVGSGKSAIARAIAEHLMSLGFGVSLKDDESRVMEAEVSHRRLMVLRERGLSVEVSTQRVRREAA